MRRRLRLDDQDGDDPLQGVANFFDLGIVFALGFMLALIAALGLPSLPVRTKDAVEMQRHREGAARLDGEGVRLGTAYRLKSGEVVYVPDDAPTPGARQASDDPILRRR